MWRWFDTNAWKIKYRLSADEVIEFLLSKGIRRIVALHYSHSPGLADLLNPFMAELARAHPEIIPTATVLPGEPNAKTVLRRALIDLNLRGVKIHCHVQKVAPDDPRMEEVYLACVDAKVPLIIHCGKEPSLPGYGINPRELCSAARLETVLRRHPTVKIVVPHMGADEVSAYLSMLDRYENLYLDTTMMYAGYFDGGPTPDMLEKYAGRILYGTDFPNIPYEWDRELSALRSAGLSPEAQRQLFIATARKIFDLP